MDLSKVKCPHCGAMNPEEAFFCSECGGQTRSLMTGTGPIDEVDGDIEIKPLLTAEPQAPPPPGPPAVPPPPPPGSPPLPPQVAAPGTGLIPPAGPPPPPVTPPPPPAYPGAPPAPSIQPNQPYMPPSAPYQGQPGGYPPGQAYGHAMPPDGNTSGMGPNYPIPPEASGWTFAGCVPWGLFAFLNGSVLWGLLALAGIFLGGIPGVIYLVYIGIQGRELAWRNRRFNSLTEFADTMSAWNRWGLIIGIISVVMGVLGFVGYLAMVFYFVAVEGYQP